MKPFTLNYHGEALTIDPSDLSWVIRNLQTAQAKARKEVEPRWQKCVCCDHSVWTAQNNPVCALCQFILDRDHHAIDCIAEMMRSTGYEPHVAAVEIARVQEAHSDTR